MKYTALFVLFLSTAWGSAWAAEVVKVQASKKTLHEREGAEQTLPSGKSRSVESDVAYTFTLTRINGGVAEPLNVDWLVIKEEAGGALKPAAVGRTNLVLGLGQKATFSTSAIRLQGREWTGRRDGEFGENLAGYAIRVRDEAGSVLQETVEPGSLKTEAAWYQQQGGSLDQLQRAVPPRLRPRQP